MSLSIPTENRKISGFLFSDDVKKNIGRTFEVVQTFEVVRTP